jgi:hypothetical protein
MDTYQTEQRTAFEMVRSILPALTAEIRQTLAESIDAYLAFRDSTNRFLRDHFADICNKSCYRNQLSACCSKNGIITFFADVVLNMLISDNDTLVRMAARLNAPIQSQKCLYLTAEGCLWTIRPIVCQMFLCDRAQNEVFSKTHLAAELWAELVEKKKSFTWPDRPILFDALESIFIDAGHTSPLMYLHNSPGLLRIKNAAGLI